MTATDLTSPKARGRQPAKLGRRLGGAFLDGLVCAAILVLAGLAWTFQTKIDTADRHAPWYVVVPALGMVCLYLTWTGARGGTLGMRAVRLRILRSVDGSTPGVVRMAVRSLTLIGAGWFLGQVSQWLLVAYVLVAAFGSKHRMIHDLIAGTVVVDDRTPSRIAASTTAPIVTDIDAAYAPGLLEEMAHLRRRSRADLHLSSVPLVVLGLLAFGGSAAELLSDGNYFWISWLYWVLAAPFGLGVTAWWYRVLRRRDGVGVGESAIIVIAFLVLSVSILVFFLPVGGAITGIGFLAVALSRRQFVLGLAAAAFGLVMGLEEPFHALSYGLSNNYPHMPGARFIDQYGSSLIGAALGVVLFAMGALALHSERS